MSGNPVLGTFVWLALRIGLLREKQIIDGPRPFLQDLCEIDAIREPVRRQLLTKCGSAEKLGFHTRAYSVCISTGIDVHGGAVRMLHNSDRHFLQIVASASGANVQGYEIVVSATSSHPMHVYSTTNARPHFNPLAQMTTHRYVGKPLELLLDCHLKSMSELKDVMSIPTLKEVGSVMDYMSNLFLSDKLARGIYVKMPELSNGPESPTSRVNSG